MKVLALLFSISVAEFVYPLAAYKRSGSKVIGMSVPWKRRIFEFVILHTCMIHVVSHQL